MSLRLGLCLPKGKKARIRLPERIKEHCQNKNIKIIEIDANRCLEAQGPFDVLLHKILDFHNELPYDEAEERIHRVMKYASLHHKMIVIDNFSWSLKLTDRKLMGDLIKACEFSLNAIKVFLPKTVEIIKQMSFIDLQKSVHNSKLKFPILVKPHSAYFANGSHDMSLVFSLDKLSDVTTPCLLQEFCNHGGVLYKVFVVGTQFNICERPSIKDTTEISSKSTIYFDSHVVSKTGKAYLKEIHSFDPNQKQWYTCDEKPDMLNEVVVKEIIVRIQKITGLLLFGFDLLIENETGNYALIDINQFPSYSGINERHFPTHLVNLLQCFL